MSPKRNPTRRSGKSIIALTVKEILDEKIRNQIRIKDAEKFVGAMA